MSNENCKHDDLQLVAAFDSLVTEKIRCVACRTLFSLPAAVDHIQKLHESGTDAWIFMPYAEAFLTEEPSGETDFVVPDLDIGLRHYTYLDASLGCAQMVEDRLLELAGEGRLPPTPNTIETLKLLNPDLINWTWRITRANVASNLIREYA